MVGDCIRWLAAAGSLGFADDWSYPAGARPGFPKPRATGSPAGGHRPVAAKKLCGGYQSQVMTNLHACRAAFALVRARERSTYAATQQKPPTRFDEAVPYRFSEHGLRAKQGNLGHEKHLSDDPPMAAWQRRGQSAQPVGRPHARRFRHCPRRHQQGCSHLSLTALTAIQRRVAIEFFQSNGGPFRGRRCRLIAPLAQGHRLPSMKHGWRIFTLAGPECTHYITRRDGRMFPSADLE